MPQESKSKKQLQGEENRKWGKIAEDIAVNYLFSQGYAVCERNWKAPGGVEVDVIAEKDFRIVFVEVKARKGDNQDPVEAVDKKKRTKMIRGADMFMQRFSMDYQYRFDIIAVTGNPADYTLQHLEDAFLPPLNGKW